MGWLLYRIPTLPLKLRVGQWCHLACQPVSSLMVSVRCLVDLVVVNKVCEGRNMMGASKNLRLEGKSYHQWLWRFLLYHDLHAHSLQLVLAIVTSIS